jgi:hypothetical protein
MMSLDKINEGVVERLTSWTHSGFNGHCGEVIPPEDTPARERAARYLVRSCLSLEKMSYASQEGKILYGDSPDMKVYDALDFLALLSCHITDRWDRRAIAYGFWSNKSENKKEAGAGDFRRGTNQRAGARFKNLPQKMGGVG